MKPFHISRLLSEIRTGECQAAVIGTRRIRRYVDEQNWRLVPSERIKAGGET